MKKLIFLLLFFISCGSTAMAEIRQSKWFSIDVPKGYIYEEDEDGIYISKKSTPILAVILPFSVDGIDLHVFAKTVSEMYKGTDLEFFDTGKSGQVAYGFTFTDMNYGRSMGIISAIGNNGRQSILYGQDLQLLKMLETLK